MARPKVKLAKLTSKNQLTLPRAVVAALGWPSHFRVQVHEGALVLWPGRVVTVLDAPEAAPAGPIPADGSLSGSSLPDPAPAGAARPERGGARTGRAGIGGAAPGVALGAALGAAPGAARAEDAAG